MSPVATGTIGARAAAERLAELAGGKPLYWEVWLRSERGANVPRVAGRGRPRYQAVDVEAYALTVVTRTGGCP